MIGGSCKLTVPEQKRHVIIAFREEVRQVAQRLSQFGQDTAKMSGSPSGRG